MCRELLDEQFLTLKCLARVFSLKLSLTFVCNVCTNSVGTESVYQTGQAGGTECLVGVSRDRKSVV